MIGVALVAIAIGAAVFVFGSGSLQSTSPNGANNSQTAVAVPFTKLAEGSQSKVVARVNYLITTQEELAKLWKLIEEPSRVPKVDFNANVVAAVFAGEAPTAGYAIKVVRVEDADKRIVNVELTRPDETCVLAQSVVAPYQIVELPKTSLPFTHADTWATKTCS